MADTERTYYVMCADKCLFEGMTKEQIITAIAEATGATPTYIDDAFITKIKEQNKNGIIKFWRGTVAEYNAIAEKDSDTLYIKTDDTREAEIDAALQELNTDIEDIQQEAAQRQTKATAATMTIASNSTKGEFEYTCEFDNSYIVVDVLECHYKEQTEVYARDVHFSVLPVYENYELVAGKKRIVAYRDDTSTAKTDINMKIIEVSY